MHIASLGLRPLIVCLLGCAVFHLVAAGPLAADDAAVSPFDGQTLGGWTTLKGEPVTQGWEISDGTIHLPPSEKRIGHIITAREFGNFVLSFEFKIAPGGNSGLKYRVQDINGNLLGCEYQIYDDDNPRRTVEPKNSTGSLYDVYEPVADKPLRPAGEYNSAKIVVVNDLIEHWLNGRLIMRAIVGSPEWDARIAESKFHDDPGFGENRFGRIMLTDHGSEVWYRNFDFTELPSDAAPATPSIASVQTDADVRGCSAGPCHTVCPSRQATACSTVRALGHRRASRHCRPLRHGRAFR